MTVNRATLEALEEQLNSADTLIKYAYGDAAGEEWPRLLNRLWLISKAVASATESAVSAARQDGATWQAIGDELGMTRQSAWERFGGSS